MKQILLSAALVLIWLPGYAGTPPLPGVNAGLLGGVFGSGADSGKVAKLQFSLHDDMPVTSIVWSTDGRYIAASSSQGNKLHIWDLQRRSLSKELQRSSAGDFRELSWSPDGRYLAACDGSRGRMLIYDTRIWTEAHLLESDGDTNCKRSAFSSDSQRLAVFGNAISVYRTADWQRDRFIDLHKGWTVGSRFEAIGYLPGTHTLVIGGGDREGNVKGSHRFGRVWLLNPEDAEPGRKFWAYTAEPPDIPGEVICLAVSPDGQQVATGTQTGAGAPTVGTETASVHVFSVADGKLLGGPLDGQPFGPQTGLEYTPDGRFLIVGHSGIYTEHAIHVIDAKSLTVIDVVHAGSTVYGVAVHPESKQFAASAGDRIIVWSLPEHH